MAAIRSVPKSFRHRSTALQIRAVPRQSQRFYAQDSKSGEEGSGIQKVADKKARPVILEHAPPAEETEDVKKHNEEFEKRPDRADNKIDPENKQTVGKQFWKGQGGADRQP